MHKGLHNQLIRCLLMYIRKRIWFVHIYSWTTQQVISCSQKLTISKVHNRPKSITRAFILYRLNYNLLSVMFFNLTRVWMQSIEKAQGLERVQNRHSIGIFSIWFMSVKTCLLITTTSCFTPAFIVGLEIEIRVNSWVVTILALLIATMLWEKT